jgi:hypothetical protein
MPILAGQDHPVQRGHHVEVAAGRPALPQVGVEAMPPYPAATGRAGHSIAHQAERLVQRGHTIKVNVDQTKAEPGKMDMRIDQTGHDRVSAQVDDPVVEPQQLLHRLSGAGRHEPLIFHHKRLCPGIGRVHRQYLSVSIERTHSPNPFRAN